MLGELVKRLNSPDLAPLMAGRYGTITITIKDGHPWGVVSFGDEVRIADLHDTNGLTVK